MFIKNSLYARHSSRLWGYISGEEERQTDTQVDGYTLCGNLVEPKDKTAAEPGRGAATRGWESFRNSDGFSEYISFSLLCFLLILSLHGGENMFTLHFLSFHLLFKQPAQAQPESLSPITNTWAKEFKSTTPTDRERYGYRDHCGWSKHLKRRVPQKATCSCYSSPGSLMLF